MLMHLLGGGRHDSFFSNRQWKAGRHSASAPPSPGPDHIGVTAQKLVRGQAQEDNGPADVLFEKSQGTASLRNQGEPT